MVCLNPLPTESRGLCARISLATKAPSSIRSATVVTHAKASATAAVVTGAKATKTAKLAAGAAAVVAAPSFLSFDMLQIMISAATIYVGIICLALAFFPRNRWLQDRVSNDTLLFAPLSLAYLAALVSIRVESVFKVLTAFSSPLTYRYLMV